jgi:hypothetical protein
MLSWRLLTRMVMEAPHKDGGDDDHHKIGGVMMEFTVEP